MTPEQAEIDMAEAQRTVVTAMFDVEGMERDAAGWNAPEVASTASTARSALEELNDAFAAVLGEKP